ncbi:trehalose-phosphatase [Amycolatopsis taiwanensis]|uniref:trehalose-phosphatase n=1 Tax=Amycolatopsis taiwanensis TaxID=342230 RepID=UPI000483BB3A|nr:trehalose-phosphatase [Amycolatopsis taiwanensis]
MVARAVRDLPDALRDGARLAERLAGRRPAIFLDYDGVLAPIVERPEDATISGTMRRAVQALARRYPVCVVSGRDRRVVQEFLGLDDLVIAGSHGFDIWNPAQDTVEPAGDDSEALIEEVTARLRTEAGSISGVRIEPKKLSVALHYRLAEEDQYERIANLVEEILAEWPGRLKVTPGKKVYELQPNIDWDKGKAVLHLLHTLGLDAGDVVPLYLGDDITDEDAFRALDGVGGVGIFVGRPDDPEVDDRLTAAEFGLPSPAEVERLLSKLAGGRSPRN